MAFVRVEQRNAHLAGSVKLEYVNGREGKVAKGLVTAISNSRRGPAESREDEATAIQWTLWGRQAENAAEYLGKGSHVNIVGRLRNNNYEKDGADVYSLAFTCEEIDYLDSKADAEARRNRQGSGQPGGQNAGQGGGTSSGDTDGDHRPDPDDQPAPTQTRKPPAAKASRARTANSTHGREANGQTRALIPA
jgi:single-strand DNA-binding protein